MLSTLAILVVKWAYLFGPLMLAVAFAASWYHDKVRTRSFDLNDDKGTKKRKIALAVLIVSFSTAFISGLAFLLAVDVLTVGEKVTPIANSINSESTNWLRFSFDDDSYSYVDNGIKYTVKDNEVKTRGVTPTGKFLIEVDELSKEKNFKIDYDRLVLSEDKDGQYLIAYTTDDKRIVFSNEVDSAVYPLDDKHIEFSSDGDSLSYYFD